jgi:hypothetical protein
VAKINEFSEMSKPKVKQFVFFKIQADNFILTARQAMQEILETLSQKRNNNTVQFTETRPGLWTRWQMFLVENALRFEVTFQSDYHPKGQQTLLE